MRHSKILHTLSLATILSLLMVVVLATPARAAPVITLSPTSGARGTEVVVTGMNFASYIGDILHIFFGGVEIAESPLTVPQDGTLMATFTIPYHAAPGTAYVIVTDKSGIQLVRSNPFTVEVVDITVDPEIGTVGTILTVHGKGLYASGQVTFYYWSHNARVKVGDDVASPIGECTYSFTVPDSSSGSHRVVVQEAYGNEAEVSFYVIPAISLKPALVSIDAELAVSGTGFSSSSDVTIYIGGDKAAIQRTNEFGSFEAVFQAPALMSRICNLDVRDEDGNTAQKRFTVAASISLSQTTGHVGEELTINGIGFLSNLPVVISYDDTPVAECATRESGAFSVSFSVPVSTHGNHQIAASDGVNLVTSLFSVESVIPPAPKLILLENPSKVKPGAHFDWEDVDDPSGITYVFQVASDADFSSVIFEKTGLALSEYVITKEDSLRSSGEVPYYWRVKAIDAASNESEWSTAQALYYFYGWPRWLQYTVVGIIWMITLFVVFRVGRRSAYS